MGDNSGRLRTVLRLRAPFAGASRRKTEAKSNDFANIGSNELRRMAVVSGQSESVTGVIPVNARLGMGFEELQLVVTSRRIVVVHKAKKGAGGLMSTLILGGHTKAFDDPDRPKTDVGDKRFEHVDVEKVLASNKNNFDLGYSEIITVEIDEGPNSTSIMIVTGEDKFQFYSSLEVKEVNNLLTGGLESKIVTKRSGAR